MIRPGSKDRKVSILITGLELDELQRFVWMMAESFGLDRRLEGTGVTGNVLHPGLTSTGFGKNNPGFLMNIMGAIVPLIARSPEKGAETSIYLAS